MIEIFNSKKNIRGRDISRKGRRDGEGRVKTGRIYNKVRVRCATM